MVCSADTHTRCVSRLCWHSHLGMLLQAIDEKGYQQELPDIWLSNGNPWEIPRPDITFKIGFYGSVDNFKWSPAETVSAAHHNQTSSCVQGLSDACLAT